MRATVCFCSYQKKSKNEVPLILKNNCTFSSVISWPKQNWASYSVFVETRGTHYAWTSYTAVQVHIFPTSVHLSICSAVCTMYSYLVPACPDPAHCVSYTLWQDYLSVAISLSVIVSFGENENGQLYTTVHPEERPCQWKFSLQRIEPIRKHSWVGLGSYPGKFQKFY